MMRTHRTWLHGLWMRLVHSSRPDRGPDVDAEPLPLFESDNVGTRCDEARDGERFFMSLVARQPEPLLFYLFPNRETAVRAMTQIPCIAISQDGGRLISTRSLTFGVFPTRDADGREAWGSLLAGWRLDEPLWRTARNACLRHGGRMRREERPRIARG